MSEPIYKSANGFQLTNRDPFVLGSGVASSMLNPSFLVLNRHIQHPCLLCIQYNSIILNTQNHIYLLLLQEGGEGQVQVKSISSRVSEINSCDQSFEIEQTLAESEFQAHQEWIYLCCHPLPHHWHVSVWFFSCYMGLSHGCY